MRKRLLLTLLLALLPAACDQRRTTEGKFCALSDFDPAGALSAGQTDFEVPLVGAVRAKPFKIPNGRWITPLGKNVRMHPFSLRVAAHPGGRYYAVNNVGLGDFKNGYQSISFIDGQTQEPLTFTHPKCGADDCDALPVDQIFGDIVFSADGSKLYAAGGGSNRVLVINTAAITMPTVAATHIPVPNFPVGLALMPGGDELLVTGFHKHEVSRVRLSDGKIMKTYPVQIYPYGVTTDGAFAYVSNLGANSVSKVNLATGKVVSMLVGVNPEGVTLSRDGKSLYVANSDSDSISVVETASFTTEATRTLDLRDSPLSAPGKSPVDIQISKDGKRMYVVLAGENAVTVFRLPDLTSLGKIPTAWYPTTLVENAAGTQLAIVSAKGFGAGTNSPLKLTEYGISNPYQDIFVGRLQKGQLTILDVPNDGQLADLSVAVDRNNNVARRLFGAQDGCEQVKGPIPLKVGQPSPIKHVVYIVRENKTYDANLGDYKGTDTNPANGDPELAIWGERVTPNLHALVKQFANHDNYYSEPEQSVQGHIWAANGWSNDFSEKVWMGMWANKHDSLFLPAIEHASRGGNDGLIFNVLKAGQDVRIYGEITGTLDHATDKLRDKFNWKYPAWSLHIRDREKAKIFIDDLNKGIFPNFVYIWLPNNHTSGCAAGRPYPVSEIMDNDEGTGMIVDAISKSRYWKDTAIFIFEDDPQSTPDHVDAHRSTLVVASPYAKRGWTSHVQLSFPSIHRTMGLMLGVPATSRYEELATPMYDAFQEEPDLAPYNYIPMADADYQRATEENVNKKITVAGVQYHDCQEVGAKFLTPASLDIEDQMPGLGRIQWHHAKGKSPYPEALVADEDDKPSEGLK